VAVCRECGEQYSRKWFSTGFGSGLCHDCYSNKRQKEAGQAQSPMERAVEARLAADKEAKEAVFGLVQTYVPGKAFRVAAAVSWRPTADNVKTEAGRASVGSPSVPGTKHVGIIAVTEEELVLLDFGPSVDEDPKVLKSSQQKPVTVSAALRQLSVATNESVDGRGSALLVVRGSELTVDAVFKNSFDSKNTESATKIAKMVAMAQ
jgi:hypothetical protein